MCTYRCLSSAPRFHVNTRLFCSPQDQHTKMLNITELNVDPCALGEAPFWDAETKSLVYVDIMAGRLSRYWTHSGRCQRLDLGKPLMSFLKRMKRR